MKKIALILVALMATCAMAVGFTGCSGSHADAGQYNVYEISEGDATLDNAIVKGFGIEGALVLDLESNGTGKMVFSGVASDVKWKDGELTIDGTKYSYTKDGDRLVLEYDGTKYTLQKKQ